MLVNSTLGLVVQIVRAKDALVTPQILTAKCDSTCHEFLLLYLQ